jgi:hypothetical protein
VCVLGIAGLLSFFFGIPSRVAAKILPRAVPPLRDVETRLRHFKDHKRAVRAAFRFAFIGHLMTFGGVLLIAGTFQPVPGLLIAVLPWAVLFAGFPVLPGGMGTGQAVYAFFFARAGHGFGAEVYTLYTLHLMTLAVMGVFFVVRSRRKA